MSNVCCMNESMNENDKKSFNDWKQTQTEYII